MGKGTQQQELMGGVRKKLCPNSRSQKLHLSPAGATLSAMEPTAQTGDAQKQCSKIQEGFDSEHRHTDEMEMGALGVSRAGWDFILGRGWILNEFS